MKQGHTWLQMASLAALLAGQTADGAQIMYDPTRPSAGAHAADGGDQPGSSPVLQSVMIRSNTRSAVIGGERVELGGKYRDAQVVSITENEVVLRREAGTESLKMYPRVEMKAAKTVQPELPEPAPARPRRGSRPDTM